MPIVPIALPQVGESVVEGIIGKWLKQPGDEIEKYDSLVEVITDKVNMEMPAPFSGTLTRILANEGDTIPMGAVIAEIDTEDPEALSKTPKPAAVSETIIGTMGVLVESDVNLGPTGSPTAEQSAAAPPRRASYSPVVMRLAQEHNVDLTLVTGTGINGRITKKDVLQFVETAPTPPATTAPTPVTSDDEEVVDLTPVRRMIAQNMVKSATQIPHAWAMVEVDLENLVALRRSVRQQFRQQEGQDITLLPFIVNAVASALKDHPYLNSTWRDGKIILKKQVNVGVAVSAPRGLVVPVIQKADSLSIAATNTILRDLVERARQETLTLDQVQGGTFTVNNTGALGTTISNPIINFPQAAILSTEALKKRPVVIDDAIVIRSMMNLSLSFDHRIIDGFEGAAFLNSVKDRLENAGPDTPIY